MLIAIGLRSEGVREWNFSIRGLGDRDLLAAAQLACDHEVWDRCINTSDKTQGEIDIDQRFPMPLRSEVTAAARDAGLDPAFIYGLIRQESRFVMDARSGVGASGLMQLMPSTAKWTAKKIGVPYTPDLLTDRDTNLRLGNAYLRLVLDDFGGSQPMAAAAYNAGPRPAAPVAQRPGARRGHLGREHSVSRDARLREESAEQRHLLFGAARRQGNDDPRPARPAGRAARPERPFAREGPALIESAAARRESALAGSSLPARRTVWQCFENS